MNFGETVHEFNGIGERWATREHRWVQLLFEVNTQAKTDTGQTG